MSLTDAAVVSLREANEFQTRIAVPRFGHTVDMLIAFRCWLCPRSWKSARNMVGCEAREDILAETEEAQIAEAMRVDTE